MIWLLKMKKKLYTEEEHFETDAEIWIVTPNRNHPNTFRILIQVNQQIRDK